MIYLLIFIGIIVLDRIVKMIISSSMVVGESLPVIGDFFRITYVQNRGAAFSILEGQTALLTILPFVVIAAGLVFAFIYRKKLSKLLLVSIMLICSGGIGNLIDRAGQSYVVDMFDFGSFPVFNVADIAVCTGCGLLVLYVILSEKKDKKSDE